ncbi:hypothetical protein ACSQ67_013974 [Phaseolus vulgaris]
MANKYAALLLVVCLIAATIVDAQESITPCLDHCVSDFAENTPQTFARSFVILVVHSGMAKSKLIYLHIYICAIIVFKYDSSTCVSTGIILSEAPQFSRKVQARLEKDYKAEMQSFH